MREMRSVLCLPPPCPARLCPCVYSPMDDASFASSAHAPLIWLMDGDKEGQASQPSSKQRNVMACMECRLAKTRCIVVQTRMSRGADIVCERCSRHHFQCVYVGSKRGRKAKSKLIPHSLLQTQDSPAPLQEVSTAQHLDHVPDSLLFSLPYEEAAAEVIDGTPQLHESNIPYDDLIENRSVTLQDLLRPLPSPSLPRPPQASRSDDSSNSPALYSTHGPFKSDLDDPVSSGIIEEDAAQALFVFFMEHMTRWSNLLDKRLHTHDFVRRRSSFLYVAILSTASKFSLDPSDPRMTLWCAGLGPKPTNTENSGTTMWNRGERLRQLLYVLCQDLAARAFADGDERSVECCQAFILTSCWRSMNDGVSSLQFGFALRLGCDLRLDAEAPACNAALDGHVNLARQWGFCNRQRTFLVLFIMDKAQQIVNDLDTRAIPYNHRLLSQSSQWFTKPQSARGDFLLCACVEFRKIQDKYVCLLRDLGHASNRSSAKATQSWLLDAILADLGDCEQRWKSILGTNARPHHGFPSIEGEEMETSTALCMLQFWRTSISMHLCCSLLALQRSDEQDDSSASGPVRNSPNPPSRASQILKFWAARRTCFPDQANLDYFLGFISPSLQAGTGETRSSNVDAVLVFHCTASAQGVLNALSSMPPLRLRTTPDPTVLQCLHAATILVSAALSTSKIACTTNYGSPPPLSAKVGFTSSVFSLVVRMRDCCAAASLSPEDTIHHIAEYMDNLLDYMREANG